MIGARWGRTGFQRDLRHGVGYGAAEMPVEVQDLLC
jgi:hypothetical protein